MNQLVILPPHEQEEQRALKLLGTIRHYVEVYRFSLGPLARAIMWNGPAAELQFLLGLLIALKYMALDKGVYEMTATGLSFYGPADEDDADGFAIEYIACDSASEQPERRDPRDRRR